MSPCGRQVWHAVGTSLRGTPDLSGSGDRHSRAQGAGGPGTGLTKSPMADRSNTAPPPGGGPTGSLTAMATTAGELESWVREELNLEPAAKVRIGEKAGTDPRCSPVITEVGVDGDGGESYSFHIERPLGELVRMDLVAALAFGGGH